MKNTNKPTPDRSRQALVIATIATFALYIIPYGEFLIYPLLLFSTFVHEMGHGIAAQMVGGSFESFEMWSNGSGVAHSLVPADISGFASALISAGGLLGPSMMAAALFYLGRSEKLSRMGLYLFGGACVLTEIFLVRNGFGLFFVGATAALSLGVAFKATPSVARAFVVFVAVQLSLSVFSRGDYLFTDTAHTGAGVMPSDTAQMADALGLSYWFWGLVVGAFSVIVLGVGLVSFFRRSASPAKAVTAGA